MQHMASAAHHLRLSRHHRHRLSPHPAQPKPKLAVWQESALIAIPFAVAIYQLNQLNLLTIQRQLPLLPALLLAISTLLITATRHYLQSQNHPIYFKVPFTDQRGYRQSDQADDALSLAIGLPFVVCSALFLSSFSTLLHQPTSAATTTAIHLMDIWNQSPQFSASNSTHHLLRFSHSDYLFSLSRARLDLVSFAILNLHALLIDLCLAILAETLDYLPISNSTRLIGSTIKSLLVSILFAVAVKFHWWGFAISQSMTPFECLFSVFTFQSSLYLTTRLARRAFTLAESSIFSSTSVALMIEVIRLTSARLRYSSYLLKQQQHQHTQPISDQDRLSFLPSLFRFPTPAIAIQHVLVSGIFLMAFTLAPLLVLSRRLGQRPTKRHRPLTRSPSNQKSSSRSPARNHHSHPLQKPIWNSEPTQPDYYSRFSNPDSQHQSRQYESALKENMRKIIALLIYASISWIGLVVMSHWLGWLFEIGQNRTKLKHQTWWRRILGPGWMSFFRYSFLDHSYSNLVDHHLKQLSTETVNPNNKISIRWTRIGMLAYWCICLMIGIGGWTGYLVQKRRSIRNQNRNVNDDQDLNKLIELDGHNTSPTNWKSNLFNFPSGSFNGSASSTAISSPLRSLASSFLTDRSKKIESIPESSGQIINQPQTSFNSTSPTTPNQPTTSISRTLNLKGSNSSWYLSGLFGHHYSPKLLKWVRQVKEYYHYSHQANNCSEAKEESLDCRMKVAELDEEVVDQEATVSERKNMEQEGLTRTQSNSSDKKIMIRKQHQATMRPTSPSLLLPSNLINSSTTVSVKREKLNFKRKFFHLLACLMFIPTIPLDIEFSSISFSVAFVIFTFCEFARYFAFYPIGAAIHLFFNEFIDSKDSGPVILSHFYLLTACSTGIWLDGLPTTITEQQPSKWISLNLLTKVFRLNHHQIQPIPSGQINCLSWFNHHGKIEDLVGILVLGFGDTFASVIGFRWGKLKWNHSSNKTVEGSIGFIVSVILLSLFLVVFGFVHSFSVKFFFHGSSFFYLF